MKASCDYQVLHGWDVHSVPDTLSKLSPFLLLHVSVVCSSPGWIHEFISRLVQIMNLLQLVELGSIFRLTNALKTR